MTRAVIPNPDFLYPALQKRWAAIQVYLDDPHQYPLQLERYQGNLQDHLRVLKDAHAFHAQQLVEAPVTLLGGRWEQVQRARLDWLAQACVVLDELIRAFIAWCLNKLSLAELGRYVVAMQEHSCLTHV